MRELHVSQEIEISMLENWNLKIADQVICIANILKVVAFEWLLDMVIIYQSGIF